MMPADSGFFLRLARTIETRCSLPALYRHYHEVLLEYIPVRNMFVALLEQDNQLIFPYYVDEISPENELIRFPKEGLTGFTIDQGRTVQLSREGSSIPQGLLIGPMASDWVGVPLRSRDRAILGVLAVQTYQAGEIYSEEAVRLIEFAALQLSLALQLHFFDRDKAIATLAAVVEDTTDLDTLYRNIHQLSASIIPAAGKDLFIARVDEDKNVFRMVFRSPQSTMPYPESWPLTQGGSGFIYTSRKTSFIYDYKKPPENFPFLVSGPPAFYWLGAPLFSRDRIIGVVVIQSYQQDLPISLEDETTLNCLCPHIAHAIQRLEFFERTRRS
ncbi:MAG: GAF domain-containing protein [Spirochaetes bacterium]|nr:GAF domain-containing protein [Spirochaetota bacterium]MBU0954251.1 GAF domain-containing protein [Spirochaetota bacterium]